MLTLEYIILGLTYSTLIISLFLQFICYSRKIENWETIALTISLLLLVVSISLSPLQPEENTTTLSTLLCMLLVSSATLFDTLSKRVHAVQKKYKILHIGLAISLALAAILAKPFGIQLVVQHLIVVFLLISIVVSMLINQTTKPLRQFRSLEKSNKIFAWIFLILVPTYLVFHFIFEEDYNQFRIGFLLYFAFIALAGEKIYRDLGRLSLIKSKLSPQEQQFHNYSLTQREREIAELLFEGLTYQSIANELYISLPTVKTHASNIYKKCKVKNRNELMRLLIN